MKREKRTDSNKDIRRIKTKQQQPQQRTETETGVVLLLLMRRIRNGMECSDKSPPTTAATATADAAAVVAFHSVG